MKTKILSFVLLALLATGCGGVQAASPSQVQSSSNGSFTATGVLKVEGQKLSTSASWKCSGITEEKLYAVIVRNHPAVGNVVWAASPGESDLRAECSGGAASWVEENPDNDLYLPSKGSTYSIWVVRSLSKTYRGIVLSEVERVFGPISLTPQ